MAKPTEEDLRVAKALAREILDSVGGGKWKAECYDRAAYRIASMRAAEREKAAKKCEARASQVFSPITASSDKNIVTDIAEFRKAEALSCAAAIRAGDKE